LLFCINMTTISRMLTIISIATRNVYIVSSPLKQKKAHVKGHLNRVKIAKQSPKIKDYFSLWESMNYVSCCSDPCQVIGFPSRDPSGERRFLLHSMSPLYIQATQKSLSKSAILSSSQSSSVHIWSAGLGCVRLLTHRVWHKVSTTFFGDNHS
jgi:hypothetical protein